MGEQHGKMQRQNKYLPAFNSQYEAWAYQRYQNHKKLLEARKKEPENPNYLAHFTSAIQKE